MNSTISFNSPRATLLEGAKSSSSSLIITELYDWHAENNAGYPYSFTMTMNNAIRGIHRAANLVLAKTQQRDSFKGGDSSGDLGSSPQVIGILSPSDTITYSCVVLAIMRSGNIAFPISPRNSPEAIAHLLMKTQVSFLLIADDAGLWEHAETAIKKVQEQEGNPSNGHVTELLSIPSFEDMFPHQLGDDDSFKPLPPVKCSVDATALILHSSGSTAFPKPILWSHRALLEWSRSPFFGTFDFAGVIMSCHSSAVYHAMGVGQLLFAATTGLIMATFKPTTPPAFPTPDRVIAEVMKTKCQVGTYVPMFLEQWAQDPKIVEYLKTTKRLVFGGGPLAKEVGDALAREGVPLCSCYGITETGYIASYLPDVPGMNWEYFEVSKQLNYIFDPREDGLTSELIILESADHTLPRVFNYEVNGRKAYATNDLCMQHPTKPHLWKIFGRADDQIMLSSGEKTNPGPLEKILEQDPHILHAIMFGRGKFYNGVLIDPAPEFAFNPNGEDGEVLLERFRKMIRPTVERMNEYAPQHSRIFKEMIIVSSPDKPFTHTAKHTVRRPAVIREYEPEIEALYQKVESINNVSGETQKGSDSEATIQDWSFNETLEFVRNVVVNVLERSVKDEDDIFQHGCDSLQATWIRMQISGMLKRTKPDVASQLPAQLVFQAPSVLSLTHLILKCINSVESPESYQGESDLEKRVKDLVSTVEKFTADIPSRPAPGILQVRRKDEGDIVLLTGSTGGLGSNTLAHLSSDPTVARIYAFNRAAKGSDPKSHSRARLEERQMKVISNRGLVDEYMSSKVVMVEGDLIKPQFGLNEELYNELRNSVTHIIHLAWPVDFNLNLSSLEGAVQGVRHLVDFALSSPYTEMPHVLFSSSVAVVRNPLTPGFPKEEHVLDPKVPAGSGYGESKWVAERILGIASEKTGLKTTSVRIGQLTGDKTGYWNEKEWFPSLVKSGFFTRCLPDVPGNGLVTWLPLYEAAQVLTQMRNTDEPILHLASAHPVPWHDILAAIATEIGVPLVSFDEWIKMLKETLSDTSVSEVEHMNQNPALKLLEFYESASFEEEWDEPLGIFRLDVSKSRRVVPALEDVKMDLSVVNQWIAAWRASGFLPDMH
ncbi:acetyl-CoA synthetase-like protein [Abortiporus biennis]|nr:acetyl-CoA synthetase-like protein [Abortiporus biennis]